VKRDGNGAVAPELRAVGDDIHAEAHGHHHEVQSRENTQRLRAARLGARKRAAADAAIPGHHAHDHEDGDLGRQQQVVRQQSRVPRLHAGQPIRADQQHFDLPQDARREQRDAAPQQGGGAAAGLRGETLHANNSSRWRYQSL